MVTTISAHAQAQARRGAVHFEIIHDRIDKRVLVSRARHLDGSPFHTTSHGQASSEKIGEPCEIVFTGTGRHLVVADMEGHHLFGFAVASGAVSAIDAPTIRGSDVRQVVVGNGLADEEVLLSGGFFRLDGRRPTVLPLCPGEGVWGRPRYSPDGRFLIAAAGPDYWSHSREHEDHPRGLWFDLATGSVRRVSSLIRAAWMPTGAGAICLADAGSPRDQANLTIVGRIGDETREFRAQGSSARDLAVHPNGKHFYLVTPDGLLLVDLSTGDSRRIANGGDDIFVIANRVLLASGHGRIRLLDLQGNELDSYQSGPIYHVAVSPYGQYVAIQVRERVQLFRIHR